MIWPVLGRESHLLFDASTFGTLLQGSGYCPVQLLRDLTHGEALPVQADHRLSVEDPPGPVSEQISTRPTVHRAADLAALESVVVAPLASLGALQD